MSAAAALSVAGLTILALLISSYRTDRHFANFEKLPRQYCLTGEPTAFASCKAMAWGVPLFLIVMLLAIATSILILSAEAANGDPWAGLTVSSILCLAAQGLIIWLSVRWSAKQGQ